MTGNAKRASCGTIGDHGAYDSRIIMQLEAAQAPPACSKRTLVKLE